MVEGDDGCEEERKLTLFFDFDQTWCSTKAGGSPLQGKHSLDDDLTDLATQHTMYVVTRNSHKAEIEQFLQAKGVRCEGVLVARKGKSKAAEMLRVRRASPTQTPRSERSLSTTASARCATRRSLHCRGSTACSFGGARWSSRI